jgi:hypothetical protein
VVHVPRVALSRSTYLTTAQLYRSGLTRRGLQAAISDGSLVQSRRGLYVVSAARLDSQWRTQAAQGLARAGAGAVLDRFSAARLLGIAGGPAAAPMTIAIPPARNTPAHAPGLSVLRTVVNPADIVIVEGLAATSPLRTVVDCARFGDRVSAVSLIESAARQQFLTPEEVDERLNCLNRARGVRSARVAVGLVELASESPLETALRLALLDAGLPSPLLQLRFQAGAVRGRIDLAYPAELLGGAPDGRYVGLAIEADGRGAHEQPSAFDHDRVRQTALEEAGWLVRRFTDQHVRRTAGYVAAVAERAIETVRRG